MDFSWKFFIFCYFPNGFGLVKVSINGEVKFIINTAKATPSGKVPNKRIIAANAPQQNPKINLPLGVVQDDIGSVAIKNAPKMLLEFNR